MGKTKMNHTSEGQNYLREKALLKVWRKMGKGK